MNGWNAPIDAYCERLGPGLWAEPLNAVSNLAFVAGALVCWLLARREGRDDDWAVRALCLVLATIGVGSGLFHTVATRWSAAADVAPILAFILLYLHLAIVRYLGLPVWAGLLKAAVYVPVSVVIEAWLTPALGKLNGSIGYVPVFLVMAGFATGLGLLAHRAWRGVATAAVILAASLTARTLDAQTGDVCAMLPIGTHWLWHLLNGTLLSVLIVTFIRHGAPAERAPLDAAQAGGKTSPRAPA